MTETKERSSLEPVTLYGMSVSGNTARARSYLINANVPYRERAPSSEHYLKTVVPLAGGVRTMPTLELPDGRVIRDGAAIIDHFENETGCTFSPTTPMQRFFSRLFDVIGSEGLLRPGMHYRWNFDAENLQFLDFHTLRIMPPGVGMDVVRQSQNVMRIATRKFGVNPQTCDLVEQLYGELLDALDRHFSEHPYLLGGRPCIGDFGMIIMLFAHLGRDPKPLSLMHAKGMNVLRWVERMNKRDADFVEFEGRDEAYLDGDEIPKTLIELLGVVSQDFVPETIAAAELINAWIAEQGELAPGTACDRGVGYAEFEVRGTTISALAQPYRFYLLKRVQDEYASMDAHTRQEVDAILEACNMAPLLGASLTREVGRDRNLEVWL